MTIAAQVLSKVEMNVENVNLANTQMNQNRLSVNFVREVHFPSLLDLQAVQNVLQENIVKLLRPTVYGVPQGRTLGPLVPQSVSYVQEAPTPTKQDQAIVQHVRVV